MVLSVRHCEWMGVPKLQNDLSASENSRDYRSRRSMQARLTRVADIVAVRGAGRLHGR